MEELARSVMPAPLRITVGERNTASATVSQRLVFVGQEEGKLMAVRQLVRSGEMQPPSIIFLHSKDRAKVGLHRMWVEWLVFRQFKHIRA